MRSEFERLPEISEILDRNGGGYYREQTKDYHHNYPYFEKFLNGAWFTWQHQQSKIDELTKQRDSFIKAYEIEMNESAELQKKLEEQTRHIEIALLAVKDIYKSAIDEFHGWDVLNEKAPKLCEHLQNLSVTIGELEQALKGCD